LSPFIKEKAMFRSRWGFHPCDYATYRKLKFLNQVYLRAVHMASAWERWQRKDPHNRVIRRRIRNEQGQTIGYAPPVPLSEPPICPVFSRKVFEQRHVDRKGNFSREGIREERVDMVHRWIPAAFVSARKPVADPAEVQPLQHRLGEVEELCEQARCWLEEQDVR
jgi:hypothetical protein